MADEIPQTERAAKLLTVAMELFRRTMVDSVSFLFANRDRAKEPAPQWAMSAIQPVPPSERREAAEFTPSIPKAPASAKPIPLAGDEPKPVSTTFSVAPDIKPDLPPLPLTPDKRPETFGFEHQALTGGFGLGGKKEPETGAVSAFDRPQPVPVLIVGPNPLPVTMDLSKALKGTGSAAPTTQRGERTGGEGGAAGVAAAIGKRFFAVLGPLYALSTVLNQTNSGMGVFQKAVNVLGATLAPVLLPVFALLAAGVLSVSDIIWNRLAPALGKMYEWALKFGIPTVEKKVEDIDRGASGIGDIVDFHKDPGKFLREFSQSPGKKADTITGGLRQLDPSGILGYIEDHVTGKPSQAYKGIKGTEAPDVAREREKAAASGVPSIGQSLKSNLQDVVKSLALSMAPKASYTGLAEVGKQAQLAALNVDPIEMKAAQRVVASIQELQRVIEENNQKKEPKDQINRRQGTGGFLSRGLGVG